MVATIGLDIGGTKVLGVLLGAEGTILREERLASPHTGLDALVATGASIVHQLASPGAPVGVGAAGLVDRNGNLAYAPNLPNVRRAPLRDALAHATGRSVVVDNDASVATRGEVTYGAAMGKRDVVLVTLGTGIGGGFLLGGRMYRGAHNFGAEVGHFTVDINGPLCACGERGHWESIASGTALGRMARELVSKGGGAALVAAAGGDASAVTGIHVGQAAATGDPDARSLLVQYAENVAVGLGSLANLLDPECIVIAGGLVELGALLFEPLREAFGRHVDGRRLPPSHPHRAGDARRTGRRDRRGHPRPGPLGVTVNIGITLPSFVDDPEIPIAVAHAAEAADLDGVFVYDHLWRGDAPNRQSGDRVLRAHRRGRSRDEPDPGRHAGRALDPCDRRRRSPTPLAPHNG